MSRRATYTRGPWRRGGRSVDGLPHVVHESLCVYDARGNQIADCEAPLRANSKTQHIRTAHEDAANADLIAAAPDLYLGLMWALAIVESAAPEMEMTPEYRAAWCALARVTGEAF